MKKLSLITLALLTLLFSQCKKEKIDSGGTDANKVKVRCDVTMGNGEKTDFTNPLISSGSIKWSQGTEYLYLVVNGTNSQIIELSANNDTEESVTTLSFSGTMSADIIKEGNTYQIWYFGNSQNLENPYININTSNDVISSIDGNIATQSGNLEDLGYHHIAMAEVTAQVLNNEVVLSIADGGLQSQIAIAYMDLSEVSSLRGDAIVGTEFSLSKNAEGTYSFAINNKDNKVINITGTNENLAKSYVVLFPNTNEDIYIQNIDIDKNHFYGHIFKNGLEANKFYYKILSDVENATLEWEYYPFLNGHEFVDLGLPSGTKWAKYNVCSSSDVNYENYIGSYYQWGSIYPDCTDEGYSGNYYSTDISGSDYDVARKRWGDEWCMPTKVQMNELISKCSWRWTANFEGTQLKGYIVTSAIAGYTDRSIFFPAKGYMEPNTQYGTGGNIISDEVPIYYWTGTREGDGSVEYAYAWYLAYYQPNMPKTHFMQRRYGLYIRPVFAPSNSNE